MELLKVNSLLYGILLTPENPLDIIRGDNIVDSEAFRLLGMAHLFRILQKCGVVVTACVLVLTFIGIMYFSKKEALADKKTQIIYVLAVFFGIANIVVIFDAGKKILDAIFY